MAKKQAQFKLHNRRVTKISRNINALPVAPEAEKRNNTIKIKLYTVPSRYIF